MLDMFRILPICRPARTFKALYNASEFFDAVFRLTSVRLCAALDPVDIDGIARMVTRWSLLFAMFGTGKNF